LKVSGLKTPAAFDKCLPHEISDGETWVCPQVRLVLGSSVQGQFLKIELFVTIDRPRTPTG
jgi:hypothetical protein